MQPLVENAIKHGKTDRPLHLIVRARVRRGPVARDGARRRARIARDAIERVLEQGVGEGTGLGLANVHLRLTAHYGEGVRLRSFPFGTVVRLEVPVDMTLRALLVDDEAPARSELRYLLRAPGVEVVGEAASAAEALDAVA